MFDELLAFITAMGRNHFHFDAIHLQESWVGVNHETSQIQLDNYTCISQGKTSSTNGGLLIYLYANYKYEIMNTQNKFTDWEGQFIKQITEAGYASQSYLEIFVDHGRT